MWEQFTSLVDTIHRDRPVHNGELEKEFCALASILAQRIAEQTVPSERILERIRNLSEGDRRYLAYIVSKIRLSH